MRLDLYFNSQDKAKATFYDKFPVSAIFPAGATSTVYERKRCAKIELKITVEQSFIV